MKLKDASINIFSGGTPSTTDKKFWNGDFHWLSSGETKNKYIKGTEKTITQLGIDSSSTRLARKHDVIVASAGQGKTRGQVSYCFIDTYINQSIIAIRTKTNILNSKYLFYNLSSRYNELRLLSDSSSSRGSLTVKIFEELDIKLPPLNLQDKIAKILSNYDDLIENNNRRIKILEEMAKKIYKEWFVDFKFPGHEKAVFKDSELGKIPSDWEIVCINDIANVLMGQSPNSCFYNTENKGLPFHQGVTHFGKKLPNHKIYCSCHGRTAKNGDILVSVRAPVGRINIADKNIIIGRGLAAINSKCGNNLFLLYALYNLFDTEDKFGNGAVFNAITKDELLSLTLFSPTKDVIAKFELIVKPIEALLTNLIIKNKTLKQTRDILLPRLISGEIDVENMEIV